MVYNLKLIHYIIRLKQDTIWILMDIESIPFCCAIGLYYILYVFVSININIYFEY